MSKPLLSADFLPDEYDEYDVTTEMVQCVCAALAMLFEEKGLPPFTHQDAVACDDGSTDLDKCNHATVSPGKLRNVIDVPGYRRDVQQIRLRLTRPKPHKCKPDGCGADPSCTLNNDDRLLLRERRCIQRDLIKAVRRKCYDCCRGMKLVDVRKYNSGKCAGHMVILEIDC